MCSNIAHFFSDVYGFFALRMNGNGPRAVLYVRVSSDDRENDGRNLQGQLEMCREHALKQGWHVVADLAEDDKGASGAAFELPELKKALDMAQA
jgi:DNA invertase Pin-like site-specific DNA recombinase